MRAFARSVLVAVGLVIGLAPAVASAADPTLVTTAPGNSCVLAYEGVETPTVDWSLNSTGRIVHYKCYYSAATAPAAGTALAWFTGATMPSGTVGIFQGYSAGGAIWLQETAGGERYANFTVNVSRPDLGYVDFQFKVYNTSSAYNWAGDRTLKFGMDVERSTTNLDQGLMDTTSITAVAWSTWATAQPAKRWSSVYSPASGFCGNMGITSTSPATTITSGGSSLTFTTTWDDGYGTKADIRFNGTDEWLPLVTVPTTGVSKTTTVTVPAYAPAYKLSGAQLRCFHPGTLLAPDGYWEYRYYGSTGVVSGEAGLTRACFRALWQWPDDGKLAVGQVVTFSLGSTGPAVTDTITIDWATYDEQNATVPASPSWVRLDTDHVVSTYKEYPLTAAFAGSVKQFLFKCTDALGVYRKGSWVSFLPSGVTSGDASSCMESSSIGALPSSWVPGLLGMASCMARALAVPSSASVSGLWASATALTQRAPISYVTQTGSLLYGVATDLPAAVASNRDSCFVFAQGLNTAAAGLPASISACPADVPSGGAGGLAVIRQIAGWLFQIGFALALWQMTRKLIAQ